MINIVIFGCGKITNRIAKSILKFEDINLYGFGSNNIEKAKEYKELYNASKYGKYEEFLYDSNVDGIYIATYNLSHYSLIKECLKHKKNVICEKPMLSSKEEINELFDLAKENKVLLMEALKAAFSPTILKIRELMNEKELGKPVHAFASFVRGPFHPLDHWIYDLKTGGSFKDLGTYTIGTLNLLFGEPISFETSKNTDEYADTLAHTSLVFKDIKADSLVTNTMEIESYILITFENGYIKANDFWKKNKIEYVINNEQKVIEVDFIDDFHYEIDHFKECIKKGIIESPVMNRQASLNIVKVTK